MRYPYLYYTASQTSRAGYILYSEYGMLTNNSFTTGCRTEVSHCHHFHGRLSWITLGLEWPDSHPRPPSRRRHDQAHQDVLLFDCGHSLCHFRQRPRASRKHSRSGGWRDLRHPEQLQSRALGHDLRIRSISACDSRGMSEMGLAAQGVWEAAELAGGRPRQAVGDDRAL